MVGQFIGVKGDGGEVGRVDSNGGAVYRGRR